MPRDLSPLLRPKSIAFVGVSRNIDSIGSRPYQFSRDRGFVGEMHVVNPRYEVLHGQPCVARVSDIGKPVDLAVIAVPAGSVEGVLADCAKIGVRSAVILTSGFAESNSDGREAQDRLFRLARESDILLCGPNSLGVVSLKNDVVATFSRVFSENQRSGEISVVSQSGAFGAYIASGAGDYGMGLSSFLSVGNEVDLTLSESIAGLVNLEHPRAIAAYVEQIRDPEVFAQAAELAASKGIGIAIFKVGTSPEGSRAVALHTGALAGDAEVYSSFFRRCGVVEVVSVEQMLDVLQLFDRGVTPSGPRVGILSVSGGAGALIADAAVIAGLTVPQLPVEARGRLAGLMPLAATQNPIDVTGQILDQPELYRQFLDVAIDSQLFEIVIVFLGQMLAHDSEIAGELVKHTCETAGSSSVAVAVCGSLRDRDIREQVAAAGVAIYFDPRRCIDAMSLLLRAAGDRRALLAREGRPILWFPGPPAADEPTLTLSEDKILPILGRYGIRTPSEQLANTVEDAVMVAGQLGYPVAMKAVSTMQMHRAVHGGVRLNIDSDAGVAEAFADIMDRFAAIAGSKPNAVLLQQMIEPGIEVFVGFKSSCLGSYLVVGWGGIHAEAMRDHALIPLPASMDELTFTIEGLRVGRILERLGGVRAIPNLVGDLERVISFCSDVRENLIELDLNPLIVAYGTGECCVVDGAALVKKDLAKESGVEEAIG